MSGMSEASWEALGMDTLGELGWDPVEGKRIAPGSGDRESWSELSIPNRLRDRDRTDQSGDSDDGGGGGRGAGAYTGV